MTMGNDPVARYEQLMRTGTPETLQKVNSEAFSKLSPGQRELIFEKFLAGAQAPDERPINANAYALATTATLVERRRPGTMRRIFEESSREPLWIQSGLAFGNFAGFAVTAAFAFGLIVSYDPGAVISGAGDPGANPGGLFGDFGTDFVGL